MKVSRSVHVAALRLAGLALKPVDHRGLYHACTQLARLFPPGQTAEVGLPLGARMRVLLSDPYWARLFGFGYQYEPEVGWVIRQVLRSQQDVQFLDLGANLGYWSAIGSVIAPNRVTAVEASPPMHANLMETARLNGNRFSVHPTAAVWSSSGEMVDIVTHAVRHAGASITDRTDKAGHDGYQSFKVPTITIDDLASSLPEGPLLVKLDVEGVETAAIDGAMKTVEDRDTVIIYEDHGQDRGAKVSRHVFDRGFSVAATYTTGLLKRMSDHEDVMAVKARSSVGYNFIAYRQGSGLARSLGL